MFLTKTPERPLRQRRLLLATGEQGAAEVQRVPGQRATQIDKIFDALQYQVDKQRPPSCLSCEGIY